MSSIRSYRDSDYEALIGLYSHSEWFGGQYSEARDSKDKLAKIISKDPNAILVHENNGKLMGSISLIEDGRVAWLFRFVVKDNNQDISKALYEEAVEILKNRGHTEVLVYAPTKNNALDNRYKLLGMNKGNDFTAYWAEI